MSRLLNPALEAQFAVFLLALVRAGGIFLAAPFYSGPGIPLRLKVGLSLFLALCLAPLLADQGPEALAAVRTPLDAALAAAGELAIGFTLGMAGAVVVAAVQTAGHLVAQDIGLTIANVIDPITSIQSSVIGQIKVALALFIFLGLDFHHGILRLVAGSFRLIPLGGLGAELAGGGTRALGEIAAGEGSLLFDLAVRLGLPIAVTLLLVTVGMAFLSRAVPEMNVFIIGFTIRILVGLWVLILTVPILARAIQAAFERAARQSAEALRALAGS